MTSLNPNVLEKESGEHVAGRGSQLWGTGSPCFLSQTVRYPREIQNETLLHRSELAGSVSRVQG